jgi:CDP-6-deoxy-D-xylo-4-hexulose-3-dehydrase
MRKTADGYPNADNVMRSGILLACHHGLNDEMLNYLHETIETFLTSVR